MTAHLSWETINDVADGRLTPVEQAQALAHLDDCTECARQLASLRALFVAADEAPDGAEPPANRDARIHCGGAGMRCWAFIGR